MQSLPLLRELPRARGSREGEKGACTSSPYKLSRTRPRQAPPTLHPLHTHGWEMLPPGNISSCAHTSGGHPAWAQGVRGTGQRELLDKRAWEGVMEEPPQLPLRSGHPRAGLKEGVVHQSSDRGICWLIGTLVPLLIRDGQHNTQLH